MSDDGQYVEMTTSLFAKSRYEYNEFGDVEIIQEVSTQIVMTPEIARNIIQVIQDNLAQNNY